MGYYERIIKEKKITRREVEVLVKQRAEVKELNFTVFIADDNLINTKVGTRFLEQYNCHVTSVVNAYQAFDLIEQGISMIFYL